MKYIESFREGEGINDIYLVRSKKSDVTKTGKPYEKLVLTDKTGSVDAMIWDPNSAGIDDFEETALETFETAETRSDLEQVIFIFYNS